MIDIVGVSKRFETGGGQTHLALKEINLHIKKGEFVSILGPSGCGKSTLLYMVGGFEECSEGDVYIGGEPVLRPGPKCGPVFQEYALFPWKNVISNVAYGMLEQGIPKAEAYERARKWLARVGLGEYADFYPRQLSGGMKQRAAIARTLAYEPAVLLMDEPFGALDAQTKLGLQSELLQLWEQLRNTVLFVTHGVDEAVYLSDRVVVLSGSPGQVHEIVDIDLPRPRIRADLLKNSAYQDYIIHLEGLFFNGLQERGV